MVGAARVQSFALSLSGKFRILRAPSSGGAAQMRGLALALVFVVSASVAGAVSSASAQTVAFKTGENQRADGVKDCYYSAGGKDYVFTVAQYGVCPVSVPVSTEQPFPTPAGVMGFKTGEVTREGVKDCYYSALGQTYVSTVNAYELCPLSIRVP